MMNYSGAANGNSVKSVFLVDDDLDDQDFFAEALSELNYRIRLKLFQSGSGLMKRLHSAQELPDIVFLDLHMPMMDGEDCLKAIRSEEKFETLPIIVYSTIFDLPKIESLFDMGANRYLQKPLSYRALVASLKRAIESVESNPMGSTAVINYTD
ncbi:MAG: response regulator [Pricia sp.]